MNVARNSNGEFRHPSPAERPSRGDVGDDHGFGGVYDLDTPELSEGERSELQQHEAVIEKGLETFYEVGMALASIRAGRLYRQTHTTFEEYCRDRWQLQERRAYQFMDAASVVETLKVEPLVQLPSNERQVRPLTSLPSEQQRQAWSNAVESAPNGKPTAAQVQASADEVKRPPVRITYGPAEDDYQDDVEILQLEETQPIPLQALVRSPSGQLGTLLSVSGRIADVRTANGIRHYDIDRLVKVADPAVESDQKNVQAAVETPPVNFNYKRDTRVSRPADDAESKPYDRMQTPPYAIDPLLPYLGWSLPSTIWEPACGEGLIVEALYDAGWTEEHVIGTDILTGHNFFEYQPAKWEIIVTNPPYSLKLDWLTRCYELGKPFALLVPGEFLFTGGVQDLVQAHGFEMMLLKPRVDFKMPNVGWNSHAQFATFWLCHDLLPQQMMFADIREAKKAFISELGLKDEPEVDDVDNG